MAARTNTLHCSRTILFQHARRDLGVLLVLPSRFCTTRRLVVECCVKRIIGVPHLINVFASSPCALESRECSWQEYHSRTARFLVELTTSPAQRAIVKGAGFENTCSEVRSSRSASETSSLLPRCSDMRTIFRTSAYKWRVFFIGQDKRRREAHGNIPNYTCE